MAERLSLSDFIITAIEEACPEVDGEQVYIRGFERFTRYCEDMNRRAQGLSKRRVARPRGREAMSRTG